MKAVLLTGHGGPEMLQYDEAPDPTAGFGEVVVDVHAASVNAADYKVRLGGGISSFPYILGRDFSGVVSVAGPGVSDLAVGDAVFGVLDQGVEGAYAEKLAIKAAIIARKPGSLDHAEARGHGADQPHGAVGAGRRGQARQWRDHSHPGRRRRRGRLSPSSSPSTSAPRLSPPPAPTITTTSAASAPTASSTTTPRTSPARPPTATWCSTPSAARFRVRSYESPQARWPPRLDRPGAGGLPTDPHRRPQPCAPTSAATAPHLERMLDLLAAGAVWPPHVTRYPLAEAAAAHRISESPPPAWQAGVRGAVSAGLGGYRKAFRKLFRVT